MKQKHKGGFPDTLLGTLARNLLGNMLPGERVKGGGGGVIRVGEGVVRTGQDF